MHPEPNNEYEKSLVSNIDSYGWHATFVGGKKGAQESTPAFCYTIGLFESYGHPEIIITGLPSKVAHGVLSDIAKSAAKGGLVKPGQENSLWPSAAGCFIKVSSEASVQYALSAHWFYQSVEFPLLQHVWPNREGILPWDSQASEAFSHDQPVIGEVEGF